jgi:hypothetical protein
VKIAIMAPLVTVDHRPSRRVSQIALPVTVDVQPSYQPPALDWRFPYRRAHHLAVPGQILRQARIHR